MTCAPCETFSWTASAASAGPRTMRYSSSTIAWKPGSTPGNCPPGGDRPGPETIMRGPSTLPSRIAVRRATSPNRPELPRSRTVVMPAARNVRARAAPWSARSGVPSIVTALTPSRAPPFFGSSRYSRWVCASMRPGQHRVLRQVDDARALRCGHLRAAPRQCDPSPRGSPAARTSCPSRCRTRGRRGSPSASCRALSGQRRHWRREGPSAAAGCVHA